MKTVMFSSKFLLIFIFAISLTACGFKLRGHAFLPPEMRTIYLQSHAPHGPLTEQLKQTLANMGITLVDSAQEAPISINILSEGTARQLSGTSTTTQINTYQLVYTVHYEIMDKAGRRLGNVRSVSANRNYVANADQVLSTNMEYNQLEQDMRRDVVYQIINQMGSKSVLRHLNLTPETSVQAQQK
jgi:LPS-assembly lipoprotein